MSARMAMPVHLIEPCLHPPRLGKYILNGVLGEGAMGTVYQGVDPVIHRPVAVKAIRRHLFDASSANLSAARRFRNEAQAAGRLSHPGIVSVYEYGEEDGTAFIAMEYVPGQTLGHYLARPVRMPEADVLSLMVQLLEALHCAHEQGVWHRDIKPANLIITCDGRLKITDFGIARIESIELTKLQQTSLLMGSSGYIAPERYTGEAPDRRVDLFSCGVLLYHLLTGDSPFAGSDHEVMFKVLHREPAPPSIVAGSSLQGYDAIVAKALAKRPDERYASAMEFREALLGLAEQPVAPRLSRAAIDGEYGMAEAATRVLQRASAPAPRSTSTALPAGWDPDTLARVEALLIEHLGPIAKVVVRRATKECADVPTLAQRVAAESLGAQDRACFLRAVARLGVAGPAAATQVATPGLRSIPTQVCAVGDAAPLRTDTVEKAQALLTVHIGPIARLLVKRAASATTQRDPFFLRLADLAADSVDREQLLRELSRIS